MNKLLIVLLAVCLVSVHAFVKRDAPAAAEPNKNSLAETFDDFKTKVEEGLAKTFNSETIKENFNKMVDEASKLFQGGKSTPTA